MQFNPIADSSNLPEKVAVALKGLTTQQASERLALNGPNVDKQLVETREAISNSWCPCLISSRTIRLVEFLEAMESKFETETRCLRDGRWVMVPTDTLVRGDVICATRNITLPVYCILPLPLSSSLSQYTHFYHDSSAMTGERGRVECFAKFVC
jgi:hypothetical protein